MNNYRVDSYGEELAYGSTLLLAPTALGLKKKLMRESYAA